MQTKEQDARFAAVANLVYSRAHAYCRRKPYRDRAEVIAEAGWAYMNAVRTYDPDKGVKFSTHVRNKVEFGLRNLTPGPAQPRVDPAHPAPAGTRFDPNDLLYDLRADAAEVVQMLLAAPGEMWDCLVKTGGGSSSPLGAKRRLAALLVGRGWSISRIKAVFHEIAEALAS
jgi:hypothetical protein